MNEQIGATLERAQVSQEPNRAAADLPPTAESLAFAATLRAWRLERRITQDELAERSGVSKSSISMAERAFHHHPPKELTQSRLATALGISSHELRMPPPAPGLTDAVAKKAALPVVPETGRGVSQVAASEHNAREMDCLSLPAKWILGATDEPANLSYLVVTDAAMQPTIRTGDVAILEPFERLAPGLYFVGIREGGSITPVGIRRVTPSSTGQILISCDSERFDYTQAGTGQMEILEKVLRVIRLVEPE